jgi:osmotically-inducible protein OsmY
MIDQGRWLLAAVLVAALSALTGCAAVEDRRSAAEQIEDTVMISRVRTALLETDEIDGTRIEVDVFRGNVQLEGVVASATEREAAARIAGDVQGVRSVENNLELEPAT